MEDAKKVVNLNVEAPPVIDRTPPVQEIAQEPAPSTEPHVVEESIVQEPVTQTVQAVNPDVDEYGVPWKNRAMEWKRKSEEVIDKLPQLIDEKLSKVTQPTQPQYTYEQLEAYKLQNVTDPNIVSWATGEQRKMQQEDNRRLFEEVVGSREQVNKNEQVRQSSLTYVQNTYPEAFLRNAHGQPTGWNEKSPLTQQIRTFMQNPKLANDPEGLAAAADMAYGRVAKGQVPQLQQKAQALKADVKQAQKASLTEGGGKRVTVSEPVQNTAINTLKKTGSLKDAEYAIGAILKNRGILGA